MNIMDKIKDNIIITENGCHEWQKSTMSAGYGNIYANGRLYLVHRYVYENVHGNIDDSMIIRHTCHNKKCCNPEHLKIGTHKDNYNDSRSIHDDSNIRKRKQWYINGELYNTIREASQKTGINQTTIIKYTNEDRIFDINSYKVGCAKANKISKI